jgi:hypothetical protein
MSTWRRLKLSNPTAQQKARWGGPLLEVRSILSSSDITQPQWPREENPLLSRLLLGKSFAEVPEPK